MNHIKVLFALAGLTFVSGCKKSTAPSSTPEASLSMPADRSAGGSTAPASGIKDAALDRHIEQRFADDPAKKEDMRKVVSELDAKLEAEDKLTEERRRTMVVPAAANFKPESSARKVRLTLILEKTIIRSGESPRYAIEMMNIGKEAIEYQEFKPSMFVQGGGLLDSHVMRIYLTDRHGKRTELLPRAVPPLPASGIPPRRRFEAPPAGMSKAEKEKWFQETNATGQAGTTFKVKLLPGETLRSVGDAPSRDGFKTLICQERFKTPGSYRLHLELNDRPEPLSKRTIELLQRFQSITEIRSDHALRTKNALGPISSNSAAFEIAQ